MDQVSPYLHNMLAEMFDLTTLHAPGTRCTFAFTHTKLQWAVLWDWGQKSALGIFPLSNGEQSYSVELCTDLEAHF